MTLIIRKYELVLRFKFVAAVLSVEKVSKQIHLWNVHSIEMTNLQCKKS